MGRGADVGLVAFIVGLKIKKMENICLPTELHPAVFGGKA